MKHAYLTKEEIDFAYRKGAITVKEAVELVQDLNRCSERNAGKKIERRGKAARQKVAKR